MSPDATRSVNETAEIGEIIDKRYRIVSVLGQGGMGSVYRAEHTRLRRPVALKLLHSQVSIGSEISKRFEREAFAAGRLDHPNCVAVSDFGELDDGTLYLVMEYVDGTPLEDLLDQEGSLDPLRALHITRHVLRGLKHAHEAGIVHRDIKPANVMLIERDGDVDFARILDFGLAKLVGEAALEEGGKKLTQAGVAFGTPLYLSPEQATGGAIDHRADVYSTSVMLYEMLTGLPPFDSDEAIQVLMMHVTQDMPAMSERAPEVSVPPEVEELVRRGMAKKPSQRYASAADYIAAVEACLHQLARAPTTLVRHDVALASTPPVAVPAAPGGAAMAPGALGVAGAQPNAPRAAPRASNGPGVLQATSAALGAMVRTIAEAPLPSNAQKAGLADTEPPPHGDPMGGRGKPSSIPPPSKLGAVVDKLTHAKLPSLQNGESPTSHPSPGNAVAPPAPGFGTRLRQLMAPTWVRIALVAVLVAIFVAMCTGGGSSDLDHYSEQLKNGESCKERKAAVAKLRKLGDKRAIPLLETAKERRDNARCLRREAQRAIDHLQAQ